jgi:hypothetical protein
MQYDRKCFEIIKSLVADLIKGFLPEHETVKEYPNKLMI